MNAILLPPVSPPPAGTEGFDFTWHMRRLCADVVGRLDDLAHIDLDRVALRFCQTRKHGYYGMHASLTPLRFELGQTTTERRGRRWTIQRLVDAAGREMLYLLSFYLPRFLDLPLGEKLTTVVHELWHISPSFDGDLRRHPGRCFAHTSSQREYDANMNQLAERWLAQEPDESLYGFLHCDFRQLRERHGPVVGLRIPTPKLIRLPHGNGRAG